MVGRTILKCGVRACQLESSGLFPLEKPMNKRHRALVVFWFFLAGLSCAAQTVDNNHAVLGTVRDASSHEPLSGVRVEFVLGGGSFAAPPQTTSTEGQFRFFGVPGDYFVLARKEGYVPARERVSINTQQEMQVWIDLTRQPSEVSSATGPGGAISAHQLTVPSGAREAYGKGMSLVDSKKDYPAAISQFESAIRDFPSYYEAYAEMGITRYYMGDAAAAEADLRKAIELSSGKYSFAIFDLAELLNNTARYADAEPVARQAVAADESSSRGYYELARAQFGLKQHAEAEASAAKARDLKPDYPLVYLMLTNIHLALHRYADVLGDIDAYLKLDPSSPTSEQVRKTRLQVTKAVEKAQAQSAALPHQ
jgi:predicted Zn-dependent protease